MNLEDVTRWISLDPDRSTRLELQALVDAGDHEALEARFSGRLEFGTAGLRGVLGGGPMRMNRLVVRQTSAGLGHYLLSDPFLRAAERGVVIGYDGRILSAEFAEDTARTLAALGIRVYLSSKMVPTPVTAYAVKALNAAAGVMVTASHNPPEYNGYKVYWGNGAQIIPPHDSGIAAAIEAAAQTPLPWVENSELITDFPAGLVDGYMQGVRHLSIHTNARPQLGIAYTPLHGVGAETTLAALNLAGFEDVHVVREQEKPDGTFPTVRFPNPEEPGAMDMVLACAKAHGADLAIANDPDADRLAVAAKDANGVFHMLRGDQIGALMGWDRLKHATDQQQHVAVATTIVSSQLLGVMAEDVGATYFETLTGFKWIANASLGRPDVPFAFGYEEALGYTVGELVRDKDGVSAAVMFCEMAAALKQSGATVLDELDAIYTRFGVFMTGQRSFTYTADDTDLRQMTSRLREAQPRVVAGKTVVSTSDLRSGTKTTGTKVEKLDLPESDVLIFRLEGGARIIVRPSGTEPKIKVYYEVRQPVDGDLEASKIAAKSQLEALMEAPIESD